jgi:RNA recognition motif-containing protein
MTKSERKKTKERKMCFTNLFVEKLLYTFQEKDVLDLFSKYVRL